MQYNKLTTAFSVIALCLGIYSCSSEQQQQKAKTPKPYKVVQAENKNVVLENFYPASVQGTVSSAVYAKISGYIDKVYVDEGQQVKKGDPLFHLETESLSEQAQSARAQVNVAKVEVQRLEPLVEKKVISEIQLETAKAKLAEKKSNLNSILANIGYATITAPVDGIVGTINYRQGALVGPNTQPLTSVSDIEKVYVYFAMNEKDFLGFVRDVEGENMNEKIQNLPPVKLLLADNSPYSYKGKIETISGNIDEQTGAVSFRASFENPNGILRDGSSGRIITSQHLEKALVVPLQATFEQQGDVFVYKVAENDSVYTNKIHVAAKTDKLLVVGDGLVAGEVVVAEGVNLIRSGSIIQPNLIALDSVIQSFEVKFK